MKKQSLAIPALLAVLAGVSGCKAEVSKADIAIATAKPVASRARTLDVARDVKPQEPDFVPEKIAQSAIEQLSGWSNGKELSDALLYCSAIRASRVQGNKSSCFDEGGDEDGSAACLVKQGYGRTSVGQALKAEKIDLNGDGMPDYILSDRYYCGGLSANQSAVYFVLLSQSAGGFRLAYADWASYFLEVVSEPSSGAMILVEKGLKTYGTFTRIMHTIDGKYVPRACVVEDDRGFHKCD